MPQLDKHGLGGGSKGIGVPIYPFVHERMLKLDDSGDELACKETTLSDAPVQITSKTRSTVYNGEIYMFGVNDSNTACYKYSPKTGKYTALANKANYAISWMAAVGTIIYYGESTTRVYKYDTATNVHSSVGTCPYNHTNAEACTDGTYIYIFGSSSSSSNGYLAYKFDPTTSTFTQLASIPTTKSLHEVEYNGSSWIFIFGGNGSKQTYRYSITNDTYTQMTDIPINFKDGQVVRIGSYFYLLTSTNSSSTYKAFYVYDVLANTYTQLKDLTRSHYGGVAEIIDNVVYILGGTAYPNIVDKLEIYRGVGQNVRRIRLLSGDTLYTDGELRLEITVETVDGTQVITNTGSKMTLTNGARKVTIDGDYAVFGGTYGTIGG